MSDNRHQDRQRSDSVARWYVASLRPVAHGLKQHLGERRTIAEVLTRRRIIQLTLASPRRSNTADRSRANALRESRARDATTEEIRARAARYRELAQCLLDPTVVSVVETCAHELEAEIPTLGNRSADETPAREQAL